jgi:hypothetical protein
MHVLGMYQANQLQTLVGWWDLPPGAVQDDPEYTLGVVVVAQQRVCA